MLKWFFRLMHTHSCFISYLLSVSCLHGNRNRECLLGVIQCK